LKTKRNSSTSGETLTLVLLRLMMRSRGWLGWKNIDFRRSILYKYLG